MGPGRSPGTRCVATLLRPLPTSHETPVLCHTDTQKPRFRGERPRPHPPSQADFRLTTLVPCTSTDPVPVHPLPCRSLRTLLTRELVQDEDPETLALIERLRAARRRGWLTRSEFIEMCRWKSPRAMRHYRLNRATTVRAVTRATLASRSERRRLALLTRLRGVNVPVASAILTLLEPRRYGVLDIRAWQLLHALGVVASRPDGRGFTFAHWREYLRVLRSEAHALGVTARAVEWTLFRCHRKYQAGLLYRKRERRRA